MNYSPYTYIIVMALVTYAIRVLPLTLIRRQIKQPLVRSFLFYVPYVTLAVMTFPAILSATSSTLSAALGLLCAIFWAYRGGSLVQVAAASCALVFLVELLL